jgi:hypothetical protein
MANNVSNRVLDLGLNVLDVEADKIYITSAEATTFTEATSTFALGNNSFGVGAVFGAPAAGGAAGSRKVTSAAITAGTITATGSATKYAVVDSVNSRLLAVGSLASSQNVTTGNPFTLPAFDIQLAGQ